MEWGTPVWWGKFLLFCVPQSVKTKETYPTRPGSPTPCKQALKVLFFEMLRDLKLADSVWPWYSWVEPKPFHELEGAQAYWGVPVRRIHSRIS